MTKHPAPRRHSNLHASLTITLTLITMLGILANAQPALAAEWIALPNTGLGDQYFYDNSKLTIKDEEITYWKKVVFKSPQNINGKEAVSGMLRERMHCSDHTAMLISYLYYSASGDTVQYVAKNEVEAISIIPDTVGDAFEHLLCPLVWQKQEESRIKEEQKTVESELKGAATHKEDTTHKTDVARKDEKKPAVSAPVAPKPPNVRLPQKPVTPLPMPQVMDQLY